MPVYSKDKIGPMEVRFRQYINYFSFNQYNYFNKGLFQKVSEVGTYFHVLASWKCQVTFLQGYKTFKYTHTPYTLFQEQPAFIKQLY
jgi:hypothetical protein